MLTLVGRNMSPYVRRVAIWCALQGREVEQLALAATEQADGEKIRAFHPGRRVPVLVLEDGTKLVDSWAICDWLDETAPEGKRLIPANGLARRDCLQVMALAQSASEKVVALIYDKNRRPAEYHWPEWHDRLADQIQGSFGALEEVVPDSLYFGGATPNGADIATVCAYQWLIATNPHVLDGRVPKVAAHAERMMALDAVKATKP